MSSHAHKKAEDQTNTLRTMYLIILLALVIALGYSLFMTIQQEWYFINNNNNTPITTTTTVTVTPTEQQDEQHFNNDIHSLFYKKRKVNKLQKGIELNYVESEFDLSPLQDTDIPVLTTNEYLSDNQKNNKLSFDLKIPHITVSAEELNSEVGSNIFIVTVVSVDFEDDLFPYFCQYYHSLGIPYRNYRVILHLQQKSGNDKLNRLMDFANEHGIPVVLIWTTVFQSFKKRDYIDEVIENTIPQENAWIVHADCDEFHDFTDPDIEQQDPYNTPLLALVNRMERSGHNFIYGSLKDRVANDCGIHNAIPWTPDTKWESLFEQFPCYAPVTQQLVKGEQSKVLLYRSYMRALWGGHHFIDSSKRYQKKRYPRYFQVNHFKWRQVVITKLEKRVETFKQLGKKFFWWKESQHFLNYMQKSQNKLKIKGCPCRGTDDNTILPEITSPVVEQNQQQEQDDDAQEQQKAALIQKEYIEKLRAEREARRAARTK
jgi:hypothetical protein